LPSTLEVRLVGPAREPEGFVLQSRLTKLLQIQLIAAHDIE